MPAPASLPEWCSNPSDPADIVEPGAAKKEDGWNASERPPAQYFNWWQNLVYLWVEWLSDERDRIAAIVDAPVSQRVYQIAASAFSTAEWIHSAAGALSAPTGANQKTYLDLNDVLPDGCAITDIRVIVDPAAGAGSVASGSRMELKLWKIARNFTTGAVAVTPTLEVALAGATTNVATMEDDDTGALQTLRTGILLTPRAIDKDSYSLVLEVESATIGDLLYGAQIVATLPNVGAR